MQVTADPEHTSWPSSDSSVSVIDDQSVYDYNTMPDFTQDLDSSSPGTLTRIIPGEMLLDEITKHAFAARRMDYVTRMFDYFCEWKNSAQTEENETFKKVSIFNSDPYELTKDGAPCILDENDYCLYSFYNVRDSPWPVNDVPLSTDITQLSYEFGYGKLSAGHLDISKGSKNFGTLG